jgi:hypothetical protein
MNTRGRLRRRDKCPEVKTARSPSDLTGPLERGKLKTIWQTRIPNPPKLEPGYVGLSLLLHNAMATIGLTL